jgi:hypothetical protein
VRIIKSPTKLIESQLKKSKNIIWSYEKERKSRKER